MIFKNQVKIRKRIWSAEETLSCQCFPHATGGFTLLGALFGCVAWFSGGCSKVSPCGASNLGQDVTETWAGLPWPSSVPAVLSFVLGLVLLYQAKTSLWQQVGLYSFLGGLVSLGLFSSNLRRWVYEIPPVPNQQKRSLADEYGDQGGEEEGE